jgi:hypothetical protein
LSICYVTLVEEVGAAEQQRLGLLFEKNVRECQFRETNALLQCGKMGIEVLMEAKNDWSFVIPTWRGGHGTFEYCDILRLFGYQTVLRHPNGPEEF